MWWSISVSGRFRVGSGQAVGVSVDQSLFTGRRHSNATYVTSPVPISLRLHHQWPNITNPNRAARHLSARPATTGPAARRRGVAAPSLNAVNITEFLAVAARVQFTGAPLAARSHATIAPKGAFSSRSILSHFFPEVAMGQKSHRARSYGMPRLNKTTGKRLLDEVIKRFFRFIFKINITKNRSLMLWRKYIKMQNN